MCDCGYTLHYKMISLILTSLEIFSTYLGCLCKQANGSHFSKLPKRGWNAKLYPPTFMLICLWAPVQLLQVHPQFWVELESEGSLVAFSEIGYHHFTSSPVDSKWPHPQKGISMLTNHVLYGKKKWWKLGVLILKKWKVHTNTAKSKGLGFLSKAKKKP